MSVIWARCLLALACFASQLTLAGEQRYEPLAASVQAALSSAVADRASPRLVFATTAEGQAWLGEMSGRLARYIPDQQTRLDFLTTVQYESKRAGLDPQLVLGLIDTESKFRKHAVSRAGARGYMQVMPFWAGLLGTAEHNLFNLRTNLRYGCVILRHYLDMERGDMQRALARYNGSLSKKSDYASNVLSAWHVRWLPSREHSGVLTVPIRYLGEP
jgi:soluble lytic murein transglycosylase-like protein